MSAETLALSQLTLMWVIYGLLHSLLADERVRGFLSAALPRLGARYRLFYNTLAGVLLLPPLWLTLTWPGPDLWSRPPPWNWILDGLALLAVAGFVVATRGYDMGEFLGLGRTDAPRLRITWAHRWVRHPWYFFGLVLLWSRDIDAAWLVTGLTITLYVAIGARLEDRKLVAEFGQAYEAYRERVPGLLPRPWRHLSRSEAEALVEAARAHRSR